MSSLASALQSRPAPPAVEEQAGRPCKIAVRGLNFYYGAKRALESIDIAIPANLVTAFIGPSGCGKSTFLRTLNRMNDIVAGARVEGKVCIDGDDIYESFRAYQRALLKEYASMADEFNFRILDARRKVEVIQDELRRQIAAFLAESEAPAPLPARVE